MEEIKQRNIYLKQLLSFKDKEPVKIITGIRRCGKSTLMKLMMKYLIEHDTPAEQIIYMNFESNEFDDFDRKQVYQYVQERIIAGRKMYIFLDEPQTIENWNKTVNSFQVDFNCDIYITGSNAYLLSSEYATYLSGRYVEIKMLPLSFKEFITFQGYTLKDYVSPIGEQRKRAYDSLGEMTEIADLFEAYVRYGGFPVLSDIGLEQDKVLAILDGIYNTVVKKDIIDRANLKPNSHTIDSVLLEKVCQFLADNIGSSISFNNISNTLVSNKMLQERKRHGKPAVRTISNYVDDITEAYLFYPIKRFDIKGKEYLQTLGKYYMVDTGLRNYLLGYRGIDTGHQIENIVYFELLRRGYDVAVGKIGNKEVDFIAIKGEEKIYYQVTQEMRSEETITRELAPLNEIKDNFPKIVLTLDSNIKLTEDGIRIINLLDFMLSNEFE